MAVLKQRANAGMTGLAAGQVLALFTVAIFLSAFLLFSVQPFFAKMVLPKLGGSPGVWSVAMVFFQSVLLLGYGYAHLLTTSLPLKRAIVYHALVLAIAFASLPIALQAGWDTPPETGQAFWLLGLFAVSVGLPFFAVSTTGPLLQAWFARTGHPHASDPYFLYAASNVGSFASLILFVVLFEPWFDVPAQASLWTTGFAILSGLIMFCGWSVIRFAATPGHKRFTDYQAPISEERINRFQIARWVGLAFVPSGLLVAVTAHISVDVAAAPLLWIVPLSLFLLSFVFAFQRDPWFPPNALSRYMPWAAAVCIMAIFGHLGISIWFALVAHLGFFFLAALFCHSLLASYRPAAGNLTAFYWWMSVGGVLGGIFASLLSPVIFNWIAEYPLLVVAVLFCRPELYSTSRLNITRFAVAGVLLAALIYSALRAGYLPLFESENANALAVVSIAVASALVQLRSQSLHVMLIAVAVPFAVMFNDAKGELLIERTFFGVVKVSDSPDHRYRLMYHGTTLHGAMAVRDENLKPIEGRPEPLTYYHRTGGIAASLRAAQQIRGGTLGEGGIVGLGAGSMLCHTKPGEKWTVYEIDRSVVDAASDPNLFRFISDCAPDVNMVVGDARLMLEREPDNRFDYLLIDAFSSDSIPIHLMTEEAIRLYIDKVREDGIVAMHISNRYFELESILAAIARRSGLAIRAGIFLRPEYLDEESKVSSSQVVVLARDERYFGPILDDPRWYAPKPHHTRPWTDNYSDIISALMRRQQGFPAAD